MQLCVRSFWPIFFATAGGEEQFWTNPRPTLGKGRSDAQGAGAAQWIGTAGGIATHSDTPSLTCILSLGPC